MGAFSLPPEAWSPAGHPSAEHLHSLGTCWPALISSSPLLAAADVLLHVNGEDATVTRAAWLAALAALPNNETRLELSVTNPGKQPGALLSMHVALSSNWFAPYEWIIRLNPDAYIYDDEILQQHMRDPHAWAVLSNCVCTSFFQI